MSDAPKLTEIDSILSSIRRVVVEKEEPRPVAKRMDKLVLTPSQRVSDPVTLPPVVQGEIVATSSPPPFQVQAEVYDHLAPIDEEVLHELVRELVAEELQGEFGEKVTGNIRKMVRAEIARALAAQDIRK